MLLNFSLQNYKNFRDKQTFYLTSKYTDQKNTFTKNDISFFNTISIYGANGSGKTNLLKALFLIKNFLIKPPLASMPNSPITNEELLSSFKLDNDYIDKPSSFKLEFIVEDNQYEYIFEMDNQKVYFEKLSIKIKKYNFIYERDCKNNIKFNEKFKLSNVIKNRIKKDIDKLGENVLFLSFLASLQIEPANKIYNFFDTRLFIFPSGAIHTNNLTIKKLQENKNNDKEKIVNFLNAMDINISDISIRKKEVDRKNFNFETKQVEDKKLFFNEIYFERKNKQNNEIFFDLFKEESEGTIKIFYLIGIMLEILENGLIVFFDELDIVLHVNLLKFIIDLFQNKNINKKGAQLIFTTHNTTLLDKKFDLFSKEQIYILNRTINSDSEIYSLNDFPGIRNEASKEDIYKNGILGGVPFVDINEIENMFK